MTLRMFLFLHQVSKRYQGFYFFFLVLAFSFLTFFPSGIVEANPIFTFVVKVKNEDGSPGKDGLKLNIKNESRDLEVIAILGEQEGGSGSCAVTIADIDEGRKVV